MDYDVYLNIKDKPSKGTDSYAVFLDDDMTGNPEYFFFNEKPISSGNIYYPLLISFFNKFDIRLTWKN